MVDGPPLGTELGRGDGGALFTMMAVYDDSSTCGAPPTVKKLEDAFKSTMSVLLADLKHSMLDRLVDNKWSRSDTQNNPESP